MTTRPPTSNVDDQAPEWPFDDVGSSMEFHDLVARLEILRASDIPIPRWLMEAPQNLLVGLLAQPMADRPTVAADRLRDIEQNVAKFEALQAGSIQGPASADSLVALCDHYVLEAFRNTYGTTYVTLDDGQRRTFEVDSQEFVEWMTAAYYLTTNRAPSDRHIKDAQGVFRAKALVHKKVYPVFQRAARIENEVWVDTGRDDGAYLHIMPGRYEVTYSCPHRFIRPRGMLPLPLPKEGGNLWELFDHVNVPEADRPVVLMYLLAVFGSRGAYPILAFIGEQASAKTTTAKLLKRLLDPSAASERAQPNNPKDVYIGAKNAKILYYDNVSYVGREVSDALCQLSTGGNFASRALYTNGDEYVMWGHNPVMLTAIRHVITAADLGSRSLLVQPEPIPATETRTLSDIVANFDEAHPRLLGAYLRVLAEALTAEASVPTSGLPRLADAMRLAIAAEAALGLDPGSMLAAYTTNRRRVVGAEVEASSLVRVLREAVDEAGGPLVGSAGELLEQLTVRYLPTPGGFNRPRPTDWPGSPRAFADALREQASSLREVGIKATPSQTSGSNSRKVWTIQAIDPDEEEVTT